MTKATAPRSMRHNRLAFVLIALFFSYLAALGATFHSILTLVEFQPITLGMFAGVASWRFVQHLRGKAEWHTTVLDSAMVIWCFAFAISIAANPETWRRSAEGLWYMLLYVGVWHVLMDALANGGLSRQLLAEGLLFAGVAVMIFAWWQVVILLGDSDSTGIPRPVSLIGNPNAFGAFLVMLIPFGVMKALSARQTIPRFVMTLYTVSAIVLLMMSQSRGGWIGAGASAGMLILLVLAERRLLSLKALRQGWKGQPLRAQLALTIVTIGAVLIVLWMSIYFVTSLSTGGRGIGLRTYLWSAAWEMFRQQPLTGQGLFTFGYHLPQFSSIPPQQPQAHAHNVPLTVAAELGIPGLVSLILTVGLVIRRWFRNWNKVIGDERHFFAAALAASVGFGIHHLVDTPAMMPLIALMGLLVLGLSVTPAEPPVVRAQWRKIGQSVAFAVLWVGLLVAGFWHISIYRQYVDIVRDAYETEDYGTAAEAMQRIVSADSWQPAYVLAQGYLYGLAAEDGDLAAAEQAAQAFASYIEMEPTHSLGWSNLAALHWQLGNQAEARAAIEQAILYAPNWPHYIRQRNIYAGAFAEADTITPSVPALDMLNWSRFQYLREPLETVFLPQVGWGIPVPITENAEVTDDTQPDD